MMHHFFLAKTEYYALFPIFKLTPTLALGDINLAGEILFDSVSRVDIERFIDQVFPLPRSGGNPLTNGGGSSNHKWGDATVETAGASLKSSEFGQIHLTLTIFSLPDTAEPELLDRTVYGEVEKIDNKEMFFGKLRAALQQHLTWETYAISYDLVLPELDFYGDVLNRHITALSDKEICQIIDIGAGTGNVTVPLLRMGRSVTAVDISRAMLDRMRAKLSVEEIGRVTIVQQDAKNLSMFSDGSFDATSVLLAFFDMTEPGTALAESMRLVRPGGFFIVTEPKRSFTLAEVLQHAEICLKRKNLYRTLKSHWNRICTINEQIDPSKRPTRLYLEDIRDVLIKSGFMILKMQDSHLGNCATILAQKNS